MVEEGEDCGDVGDRWGTGTVTQAETKEAVHGQLDEMKALVQWVIGVAFVSIVLAVQGQSEFEFLGLQVTRKAAFFVLSAVYVALTLAFLGHAARLGMLFRGVPKEDVVSQLDQAARHSWLFNPFAPYRLADLPKRPFNIGFTGLVISFWMCASSLVILAPGRFLQAPVARLWGKSPLSLDFWATVADMSLYMLPFGAFIVLGWLAMQALIDIYSTTGESHAGSDSDLAALLNARRKDLESAADLGIGLGGIVFTIAMALANLPWLQAPAT